MSVLHGRGRDRGYGRRARYREQHRRDVERVLVDRRIRRERALEDGTFSGDGEYYADSVDSEADYGFAARRRRQLYHDLDESREGYRQASEKQREVAAWAKELIAVSGGSPTSSAGGKKGGGGRKTDVLSDILREAQGLPMSAIIPHDIEEELQFGSRNAEEALMIGKAGGRTRGYRVKKMERSGRVVKDLSNPAALGKYGHDSVYSATGRKYRSRSDSMYRNNPNESQRRAAQSRVSDRVLASQRAGVRERNRRKQLMEKKRSKRESDRMDHVRRQEYAHHNALYAEFRRARGGGGGSYSSSQVSRSYSHTDNRSLSPTSDYAGSARTGTSRGIGGMGGGMGGGGARGGGGGGSGSPWLRSKPEDEDVFDALRRYV